MLGNILQIILILFWAFILPLLLGLLWTGRMKRYHNSVLMAMVMGWMTMFAAAQLLAVPMIVFTRLKFHVLVWSWCGAVLLGALLSVILNRKRFAEIARFQAGRFRDFGKIRGLYAVLGAAAAVILFTAVSMSLLWYDHYDDIRYVATAVDSWSTDTMLKIEPVSGEYLGHPTGEMWKDAVAPINIFWAMLSKLILTHPAIVMHMIVPFVMILLAYMIYAVMGDRLFHGKEMHSAVFLLVFSLLMLYGCYSFHGNLPSSILLSPWWGKSLQAGLSLPFLFTLFLLIMDEEENKVYYPMLFCTMWATALMTTMSAIIPTLMTGTYGLVHAVSAKKAKPLIGAFVCCIPCMVYGVLFFFVKGW